MDLRLIYRFISSPVPLHLLLVVSRSLGCFMALGHPIPYNKHKTGMILKFPSLGFDKTSMPVWEADDIPWDSKDQWLLQSFPRYWLEMAI